MWDPKGYYSALGVEINSEFAEIKSAYRQLAKKYHPDGFGGSQDSEKIRFINEAYDVLGDAAKRAIYDSGAAGPTDETSEQQTNAPLRCDFCGRVAAFPRSLVFWRVYSLLIVTSSSPVQGMFCANCANSEAMRSTLMTSLLGWWGIPWGPILTLGKGFGNAKGGEGSPDQNETYLWYKGPIYLFDPQRDSGKMLRWRASRDSRNRYGIRGLSRFRLSGCLWKLASTIESKPSIGSRGACGEGR